MAEGTSLAKAYVQILPSMKGFKDKLEEGLGGSGAAAGKSSGASFGGAFASAAGTAIKASAAAITAGVAGVSALTKSAVDAYADFEQLSGGVETLFKDSAETVQKYAADAYSTAGLTANEYMETVTSFSASLIQSTGRGAQQDLNELSGALDAELLDHKRALEDQYDEVKRAWDERIKLAKENGSENVELLKLQKDEELKALKRANEDELAELKLANEDKLAEAEAANNASETTAESLALAAELADQAIIDMSDNANKMGTSMEAIQNAYQGFAKQNYTMLDNLKLGYGGTKTEMERLLADASKLSGQTFSLDSYADVIEAIHVIQDEMGISGTTAKEAASTIQGSLSMTKSAWENLVAGIANPDADIGALVDKLVTSAGYAADNLIPVIKTALEGAGQLIAELAPEIFGILPDLLNDTLPGLMNAVNKTITNVIPALADGIAANLPSVITSTTDALQTALPQLYNAGKSIVGALGSAIAENSGEMLRVAMELVTALMDDIGDSLPKVLPQIAELIVDIADTLTSPENLTPMIKAALGIIKGLADGILEALPTLVRAVPQIISNIMTILTEEMPKLLTTGQEVLTSLITGILDNLPLLVQMAFDLVDSLVTFVLDNLPQLLELAAQLILALVQGITENLPKIAEGAGELIPKIIATVVDKLPEIIDTGFEITVELVKGILKALPKIVESVVQLIGSMVIKFTEYDWLSLGKNLILGIKDGIVQYAYELINAVTDAGEKAYNAVKDFFGIASPSKLMRDGIGAYLPAGIAAGIMANEGDVTSAMNALADDVSGTTFGLPDIQGGNYSGANGGYGAYAAQQPAIIQFVLPNGQVIAQWLEPDISAIQDRKIMIGQRGYAT
ncbi:MAG: hypothetical protein J6I46_05970 [Ruminococcus sp.]|nr:hypothetical protein [Ruminococcus sp.]